MKRFMTILALGSLWALQPAQTYGQTSASIERLAQKGQWFVDPKGHTIMLHGGNVSVPDFGDGASYNGRPALPWTGETPQRMAEQGFNGIRLVIFFSYLMPKPGVVDQAYLDRIARTVAEYKKAGIYTLIDFHQDQYSSLGGGRGMPDWAVFSDGYKRNPDLNFPMGYFKDPAVQRSFDNFWRNHPVPGTGKGVQDLYVEGLAAVASRFRDEPAVLGIDVMNEPATGSRCAVPDPVKADCPELEQEYLRPFYEKASTAIAQAAPDMMIFVEPFMLQGALGTPINTPIVAPEGRRGLSFHNYGPVKATRDKVNDGALAHAIRSNAAIINTEWGFSNDPAAIAGQADDFDARGISWLAWTRGAFEALVDPKLPDRGNGNRLALLRAYARPYPQATAGTPQKLAFDGSSGTLTYHYGTKLPDGRAAGDRITEIRVPEINFPKGYTVKVNGGNVLSAENAPVVRIRNHPDASSVSVTLVRTGALPALPVTKAEPDSIGAALSALPPIPEGPLTRKSLLGHIVATPGGREILEKAVPGMLAGLSHVHGWEKMTMVAIQQFASAIVTDAKLAEIDAALASLPVKPGPVRVADRSDRLSTASLTSDLLADPRARAILEREAPGLATSSQQGLFPQTSLRNLKPAMPEILTDEALLRIEQALAELK